MSRDAIYSGAYFGITESVDDWFNPFATSANFSTRGVTNTSPVFIISLTTRVYRQTLWYKWTADFDAFMVNRNMQKYIFRIFKGACKLLYVVFLLISHFPSYEMENRFCTFARIILCIVRLKQPSV